MAILWQKSVDGTRYEVRSAGRTIRLYTNGVCHSEYNPRKVVTGSVWDLLFLPAFFHAPGFVRRILVLGVGGGASLLQMETLLESVEIAGVDSDAMHLYIARRFFGAGRRKITLHEADARQWILNYEGEPFDLIIDDLFVDRERQPVRPVQADRDWALLLLKSLSGNGVLAVNFASRNELRRSAFVSDPRIARQFPSTFKLTTPYLDNAVGVFHRMPADGRTLRSNLRAHPILGPALLNRQLRYRILALA